MKRPRIKSVGFASSCAPDHVRTFYSRLIEYFAQELGEDFEVVPDVTYGNMKWLDGRYRIIVFGTRGAAGQLSSKCSFTKSFLIDHGPIHTNRAPHTKVDFEVFSSPYLNFRYPKDGMDPKIKSWSGGYFLTDHLDHSCPRPGECLVYLLHNVGWKANTLVSGPFRDEETLRYLKGLSQEFQIVHVVSHLNGGLNFAIKYRERLPQNVLPVAHGLKFMSLINNVEAVFFEYSSVIASVLWNPAVKIFQRVPPHPCGPVTMHAKFLHELMQFATYPIVGDDLSEIRKTLLEDPKIGARREAKGMIFDDMITDPYAAALDCLLEALRIVTPAADQAGIACLDQSAALSRAAGREGILCG